MYLLKAYIISQLHRVYKDTHPHTGQIILESTPLPRRHRSQKLWKQVKMQGLSYGSLHRGHCNGFHFLESTSSGFSMGWKISPDILALANTLRSPVSPTW